MEETKPSYRQETEAVHTGHRAAEHQGSVKPPLYFNSTFTFASAEAGKAFFEQMQAAQKRPEAYLYSRMDHPNYRSTEARLARLEGAEEALLFASGMAAISSAVLAYVQPGDLVVHSNPLYGGTDHLLKHFLQAWGVKLMGIEPGERPADLRGKLERHPQGAKVKMLYLETPANPTMEIFDLEAWSDFAQSLSRESGQKIWVMADNTYLGPLWQKPLEAGVDLALYSATKYLAGHSDLLAGAVMGSRPALKPLRAMRSLLGGTADPHMAWLLMRSLETLYVRMEKQADNARKLAGFLAEQKKLESFRYLGRPEGFSPEAQSIIARQCKGAGAMMALDLGSEARAFCFLNALEIFQLAVSLGSTESLAQHPATMTHAGVDSETKTRYGIGPGLVRLSIGVEAAEDLIADLRQALAAL